MEIDTNKPMQRRGGFQPGVSGNPKGKPKGAVSRHARLVARLATEDVENVITAIIAKAKEGDTRAAELVLRYAAPLPRTRLVKFPLPPLGTLGDVTAAIAAVLEGVSAGLLTIEEGAALADILERHSSILKNDAIERRLRALEAAEARRT